MTDDPPTSSRGTRRSRRRSPPASLPAHFARKGYLSVSDLVGPSWCEYNYQYGILSLSHLPPSQRPATITTETGTTLAAAPQLVAAKEATLTAGKAVHTVLEREVAPVTVVVETQSKEDGWALRLLNLWCDMQGLLQLEPGSGKGKGKGVKCVREVPVYGWVHGVLVMGVIDEIEKRSIAPRPTAEKGKTWSSQEEWKKDQRKTVSPKKTTSSRPLTAFFSSQPKPPEPERAPPAETKRWAYFLSDTKTRIASWLPAEEDQHSARMQCMTYKRLFDGLLLGALRGEDAEIRFDPNATPMDWDRTFASLDLDPHQPLSEAFLRDAEPLCQSWGTDLTLWVAQNGADVCTLHHVRLLLEQGLRALVENARQGHGTQDGEGNTAVIQDQLALTYRKQKQRRRGKRKKAGPNQGSKGKEEKQNGDLRQLTLEDSIVAEAEVVEKDESLPNETLAADVGTTPPATEAKKSLDALEGRNDALEAISTALSPPPCTPRRRPSLATSTSPTSPTPTTPPDPPSPSSSIIGIVTFAHDPFTLDAYLTRMIRMWKGERALEGVRVDQTRRCWTCEWMDGCEWRAQQADRRTAAVRVKTDHSDAEEGEFWSNLDYESIEVRDAGGNLVDW